MKFFIHVLIVIAWSAACTEIVGHGALEGLGWWLAFSPIAIISQVVFTSKPRK